MEGDDKFAERYRINSTRLPGWNYGDDGYYFVTICTENREFYFGDVLMDNAGEWSVALTPVGKIVVQYWLDIPKYHPYVVLDEFIVMPNHMHGIIQIDKSKYNNLVETRYIASHKTHKTISDLGVQETPGMAVEKSETPGMASLQGRGDGEYQNTFGPQRNNLASIIRGYKSGVTTYAMKNNIDFRWQTRYYDRIIRTERALNAVRRYITDNPKNWRRDRNNTVNLWM